jgi:hypothetical protein
LRGIRSVALIGFAMVISVVADVGPVAALDTEPQVVEIDLPDNLVDLSVYRGVGLGVTDGGDVVAYDLNGPYPSGHELDRFDVPGVRRVAGQMLIAGDRLWLVPFDGGGPLQPEPYDSWGALPAAPLRDLAGGNEVWYVVAGSDRINAYELTSLPWVSSLVPEHGDPLLLDSTGWAVLTGDGSQVEILADAGGADVNQEVAWTVVFDNPEGKQVVGIELKPMWWDCLDAAPEDQRDACAIVVAFPDEIVEFDGLGARASTVYRPSPGRAVTGIDRGDCDVLYASETGPVQGEGAIVKIVPAWRDPGCFSDIGYNQPFYLDVQWLGQEGTTRGCNPPAGDWFCPDDYVTRGQVAALFTRALHLTNSLEDPFTDDNESIFEADIDRLAGAGISRGCNPPANDRFCPDEYVTRGEMAAFLVRAMGYTDDDGNLFVDDDESVFEGDIDRLGSAGVTRGCNPPSNDRFCPDDFVTRGQAAAFLHRALG